MLCEADWSGGTRRQTKETPFGRQMASASASTAATSRDDISPAVTTVTIIGGMAGDDASGRLAATIVDASNATTAVVTVSIMSAIDGCDRQKFDVRNREKRTPLNLEIDRHDVFG